MTKLDQYVISCIYQYPALYRSYSYQEAKIKVLDHLLNVIGNGIINDEDLNEKLEDINPNLTMEDIKINVSSPKIFIGYTGIHNDFFHIPKFGSSMDHCVLEEDKHKYPDVVYWLEVKCTPINLYPNFKEAYSTVYRCQSFLELDKSFIEGAIEFYKFAEHWIANTSTYNYAFPKDTEQNTKKCLYDMQKALEKYETNEAISDAYGIEYTGDLYEFMKKRWETEKVSILDFITRTLKLLSR